MKVVVASKIKRYISQFCRKIVYLSLVFHLPHDECVSPPIHSAISDDDNILSAQIYFCVSKCNLLKIAVLVCVSFYLYFAHAFAFVCILHILFSHQNFGYDFQDATTTRRKRIVLCNKINVLSFKHIASSFKVCELCVLGTRNMSWIQMEMVLFVVKCLRPAKAQIKCQRRKGEVKRKSTYTAEQYNEMKNQANGLAFHVRTL